MPLETKNRVTCTGCSLLCDDIAVDVQFGAVQAVHNACLRGSKKFLPAPSKQLLKSPAILGKECSPVDAITEAARILKAARRVVITCGAHVTNEAMENLVRLAEKLGARLVIPDLDAMLRVRAAVKNNGIELFTLGEVLNNADTIVFWGANPIDLAPKLLVRTAFSRGRFRQSGKEVKKLAVIDDYPTPTMERADIKILVDDQDHDSVLDTVSGALFGEKPSDQATVDLVDALRNCEYCTFFLGEGILNRQFLERHPTFLDRIIRLIRDLNRTRRAAIAPLFYSWNAAAVAGLQRPGTKYSLFDEHDLPAIIESGSAILAIGHDLVARCPSNIKDRFDAVPVIAVDFKRTPTTDVARVVLPVSIAGVDTGGTATRLDRITVNLNPPLSPRGGSLDDVAVLKALYDLT